MGFIGAVVGWVLGQPAEAAPPETAPAALINTLEAIETAANAQDLEQLMALYSPNFVGPDGFTRDQYQATLSDFWEQYTSLNYEVELLSWESDGTALVAETLTTVEGSSLMTGRAMQLTAELRSQQRYENGQLVSQKILSEQNQLTAGVMPPNITVQLPDTVAPGSQFTYDAIVIDPLGNRLLLGLAFDEGVTSADFFAPRPVGLEALAAGGLFKIGNAPEKTDQRWISAVIVREDGMVIDTRRLVVQPN
ncbi:MAG: nuclear transport factor 2 family protein [Leptolyngbya sp. SIOISBB]|nr:nuclear transport factor 2 family protein [Leptolyngbya sp. SIOISBB]